MKEIWKPVAGFYGYEISDMGRIKGPRGISFGSMNAQGYRCKSFSRGSVTNTFSFKVHRLVAEAFLGPCPPKHEVNHKNGIKHDNRLENLEYVTRSENISHAYTLGLQTPRKGVLNGRSKLSELDVLAIMALIKNNLPQGYIANRFGVTEAVIRKIKRRKSWVHLSASAEAAND